MTRDKGCGKSLIFEAFYIYILIFPIFILPARFLTSRTCARTASICIKYLFVNVRGIINGSFA